MYDTPESQDLVARFALKHPEHRAAIQTAIHAVATTQNRALFYVPAAVMKDDKHFIRVHVHDLVSGALIDIGAVSTSKDTVEGRFFDLISSYKTEACPSCIERADLCEEHVPANRPPFIRTQCPNCGYDGSKEKWRYKRECCGQPVYECFDCDNEHEFSTTTDEELDALAVGEHE